MTDFAAYDAERRLFILRFLVEMEGSANETVIIVSAERGGFHNTPREEFRRDLDMLAEMRLTREEWLNSLRLVTITERGRDAAFGRTDVAGVKHEIWRRAS